MDTEYDYKIKYRLNDNDYYEYNKIYTLTSKAGKKALMNHKFSVPTLTLIFLIAFIVFLRHDINSVIIGAIAMVIMNLIWIIFSDKIYFRNLKKSIAKIEKDGTLPYDKSGELIFDSDGITDISEFSVIKRGYSAIEKIIVTEKAVYLYTSATNADIINSDFFKDEDEKTHFVNYIISKANNANVIEK